VEGQFDLRSGANQNVAGDFVFPATSRVTRRCRGPEISVGGASNPQTSLIADERILHGPTLLLAHIICTVTVQIEP
jgi:hypothetical protein